MTVRRDLPRFALLALLALALAPAAALAAPTWLDPVILDDAPDTSNGPDVAAFGDGNSAAVWLGAFDDVAGSYPIYASVRPRGGPWVGPQNIESAGGAGSEAPLVTALPNGDLVAVWLGTGGLAGPEQLRWARRTAAGGWGQPGFVADGCCEGLIDLVPGGDGSATVLWTDEGSPRTNTLPAGATQWGPIEPVPVTGQTDPALAVAGDGTAVAAWRDCFGGCVKAAFKPAGGGSWSTAEDVGRGGSPVVGLDAAARLGNEFTVGWAEQTSFPAAASRGVTTYGAVFSSDRTAGAGGSWQAKPDVVDTTTQGPPGCRSGNLGCLDLSAHSDGSLALLYQQTDYSANASSIAAALRAPGGSWGEPENAGDAGLGDAFPHATYTSGGTVAAAWIAGGGGPGSVARGSHRPPGGGWSPTDLGSPLQADTTIELDDIAADGEGNGVTAWNDVGGILAAGFDGAGPRIQPFTLPPTGPARDSRAFSAGANDAWSGIAGIGWSFGDGGSAAGASVSHAYAGGGLYTVTATATDRVGNTGSSSGQVTITNPPITPPPGCPGDVDADGICDTIDPTNGATLPVPFKTVNARVISGEVFIKLPAGGKIAGVSASVPKGYSRLVGAATIPVGSTLDTTKGRVELRSAADTRRRTQKGQFFDGRFRIRQERKPGRKRSIITELALTGSSFAARCGSAGKAAASARSKRRVRRLWGDGKGAFRTKGRHAAATVRGTRWLVEDRCDGTLVKVSRGRVEVRDKIRLRTVQVRAGRSYLARLR